MRVLSPFVFLAIVLSATLGCTHRIYAIGVDNPESTQTLHAGSKLSVMKFPSKEAFKHDTTLERKMGEILSDQGYEITEAESAAYFLLYDYRVTGRMAHMKLELLTGTREGMHTVRRGGPYSHVLELRLVDAPLFRENNYRDAMIWQGGAVLNEVPTTSPKFHDLVLLAAFAQFGKNTDDSVTVRMSLNNTDARSLRD